MESAPATLFRFVQVELPWPLGPPDGRYLLRPAGEPDAPAVHVIVLATLGAPERRRPGPRRRSRPASPEPAPTPVSTGRATVIDVGRPLDDAAQARAWLERAGEEQLAAGLNVLNRTLQAFRIVTADPYLHTAGRQQAIAARIGFGAGEQVADGRWADARELRPGEARQRRSRLHPQARLAAVLGGREVELACEELTLRARADLEQDRGREAALQVLVALDAALAELARDPTASALGDRLNELRGQRKPLAAAAQAALAGPLAEPELETVRFTVARIEAILRARAAESA